MTKKKSKEPDEVESRQPCSVVGCDEKPAFLYAETLRELDLMLPFCLKHWETWRARRHDYGQMAILEDTDKVRVLAGGGVYAIIDKRPDEDGGKIDGKGKKG